MQAGRHSKFMSLPEQLSVGWLVVNVVIVGGEEVGVREKRLGITPAK